MKFNFSFCFVNFSPHSTSDHRPINHYIGRHHHPIPLSNPTNLNFLYSKTNYSRCHPNYRRPNFFLCPANFVVVDFVAVFLNAQKIIYYVFVCVYSLFYEFLLGVGQGAFVCRNSNKTMKATEYEGEPHPTRMVALNTNFHHHNKGNLKTL